MVFGPLADIFMPTRALLSTEYGVESTVAAGDGMVAFSFAINVLPIIIFFAALMSVLYHLRIMEWLVAIVGGALRRIIGTGAVESMNAAANIFVGQTEAPRKTVSQRAHRSTIFRGNGVGAGVNRGYRSRGLCDHGREHHLPARSCIYGGAGRSADGENYYAGY